MSNSRPSSTKFWVLTVLVLLAASAGLASFLPSVHAAARDQSAKLVEAGDRADGAEAASEYLLATKLDAANQRAYARLADAQIASGQPDAALTSLKRAGEGSDVVQLRVRTLIELGRYPDAANAAAVLAGPGRGDSDLVLAALAFVAAGRAVDAAPLAQRVTSPQATQRIVRASGSQLTLAAELYAEGLLKSSSGILESLPPSYERNMLLARIRLAERTKTSLAQAASLAAEAVAINPATAEAHRFFASVLREQRRDAEAAVQDTLASKILAGRP